MHHVRMFVCELFCAIDLINWCIDFVIRQTIDANCRYIKLNNHFDSMCFVCAIEIVSNVTKKLAC